MKKTFLKVFLIVLVTSVLTGFLRWEHLDVDLFVSFIVYFIIVSLLCLKFPTDRSKILYSFLSSVILVSFVAGRLLDGVFPILGIPNIFMALVGIVSGYLFSVFTSKGYKAAVILVGLSIASFLYLNHDKWLHYLNYGNLFGTVEEVGFTVWKGYNKFGDTIAANDFNEKIVLLDFWNTGCVVCFTKFPHLQELYYKYEHDSRISIYAVNIPMERDSSGMAFNVIQRKKYTFPTIVGDAKMDSIFKVTVYPTVIVLDRGKVVFRGALEQAAEKLEDLAGNQNK